MAHSFIPGPFGGFFLHDGQIEPLNPEMFFEAASQQARALFETDVWRAIHMEGMENPVHIRERIIGSAMLSAYTQYYYTLYSINDLAFYTTYARMLALPPPGAAPAPVPVMPPVPLPPLPMIQLPPPPPPGLPVLVIQPQVPAPEPAPALANLPVDGPVPIPEFAPVVDPFPIPEVAPVVDPFPIPEVAPVADPLPVPEAVPMVHPFPVPEPAQVPDPIPQFDEEGWFVGDEDPEEDDPDEDPEEDDPDEDPEEDDPDEDPEEDLGDDEEVVDDEEMAEGGMADDEMMADDEGDDDDPIDIEAIEDWFAESDEGSGWPEGLGLHLTAPTRPPSPMTQLDSSRHSSAAWRTLGLPSLPEDPNLVHIEPQPEILD